MDSLGMKCRVRQLRAEYKKQVMLGDVLVPYTAFLEEGKYVIALKDKEGALCCIVELTEDDR